MRIVGRELGRKVGEAETKEVTWAVKSELRTLSWQTTLRPYFHRNRC